MQHEFKALKMYLSSFWKKTDAKIYIVNSQHQNTNIKGDLKVWYNSDFDMTNSLNTE